MTKWVCNRCKKVFRDTKPLRHGDFIGNFITGFEHEDCKGILVEVK